jgi:hypothetical protein
MNGSFNDKIIKNMILSKNGGWKWVKYQLLWNSGISLGCERNGG